MHLIGQMETQCAKKCGETVQQEIEVVKAKYEETIKSTKMKLLVTKTQNIEYLNAIKVRYNAVTHTFDINFSISEISYVANRFSHKLINQLYQ